MLFSSVFLESADEFVRIHNETGSVTAGSNGPHGHQETPVRNAAHWIVSLVRAYRLTQDLRFHDKAIEIATLLTGKQFRPHGYSFHAREDKNVDRCNGLIGQAWVMEALAELTDMTGDEAYRTLGAEVVRQHKFNSKFSLWHSLDIDGTVLNIDNVFNHQLWFCAAAVKVGKGDDVVMERVTKFMSALDSNFTISPQGLIDHHIRRALSSPVVRIQGVLKHLRNGTLYHRIFNYRKATSKGVPIHPKEREIGYQAFNTFAFAMLKDEVGGFGCATEKVRKSAEYLLSDEFREGIADNKYGFGYNPPGFEIPYSIERLLTLDRGSLERVSNFWLEQQFQWSYDGQAKMFARNCVDPATQSARLYEITRLSDDLFNVLTVSKDLAGVYS